MCLFQMLVMMEYLQQGNSVGEVADTLNFFDSFHFSKAFKNKFGYAPSAVLKNTDQHPTDASPHN